MANGWSHAHGKTGSEVVPSTWQPTTDIWNDKIVSFTGSAIDFKLVTTALVLKTSMTPHRRLRTSAPVHASRRSVSASRPVSSAAPRSSSPT